MADKGKDRRVCVGVIAAPHGVRGAVKVRCFTESPDDVTAYGPVEDEAGRRFSLVPIGPAKGGILAHIAGVEDREAARRLRGTKLFVPRSALPEPEEDAYYYEDLVGLAVETIDGRRVGEVRAVHDFGAGDVLEVRRDAPDGGERHDAARVRGKTVLVPFTQEVVPQVRLAEGRLIIAPPPGLLEG